ncbi:MAG: hypothetical protein HYR51_05975 [Candidatus Rokubacteria bacterium]|nr:hypothetical protein [Candidatus Rokubacteria bacterium]
MGLVTGVWVFADLWVSLEGFVTSGELETSTLAALLGVPFWVVAVAVGVVAVVTFRLIAAFEARRNRSNVT